MNIETNKIFTIKKEVVDDKTYYKLIITKNNGKVFGEVKCRFKDDIEVDTNKKIKIIESWLDFYIKKSNNTTVPYIFINQFEYC